MEMAEVSAARPFREEHFRHSVGAATFQASSRHNDSIAFERSCQIIPVELKEGLEVTKYRIFFGTRTSILMREALC